MTLLFGISSASKLRNKSSSSKPKSIKSLISTVDPFSLAAYQTFSSFYTNKTLWYTINKLATKTFDQLNSSYFVKKRIISSECVILPKLIFFLADVNKI